MARIKQNNRTARGKRIRRPVIYIICEGAETEIRYFRHFRTRYSNIEIKPVPSQYKSATELVEHARNTIRQEPYYPEDGDQIWCVFDRDENTNEELQRAEQIARQKNYNIAFSNPSFELWYLLHFTDRRGYLNDCDAIIKILKTKGFIKNYTKANDYYDTLFPMQQQAVKRSNCLLDQYEKEGKRIMHRDTNPCTTVSNLVSILVERARGGK